VGQATFFRYISGENGTAVARGKRARISPQGYFYWGPFGLLWEHVSSTQGAQLGTEKDAFTNSAWQIAVSYVLTGENKTYRGVVPKKPFDPFGSQWGWGAFEPAFRWNALDVDDDAFTKGFANSAQSASKAEGFGIAVNWYLNQFVKLVLDFERTTFDGGASSGDRSPENVLQTRVQLAF
jgi:phosphate-selective porin OprO/OprP